MKRMHLAACLAVTGCFVAARSAEADCFPKVAIPTLPETAATPQGFVPPGWHMEDQGSQDLNGDGSPDLVMVLRDTDKKNVVVIPQNDACGGLADGSPVDTNPYLLVVAFANPGGKGYHRVLQNATFIPRDAKWEGDVNYNGIIVRHGSFSVKLNALTDTDINYVYTLRFQHDRFELIGYDEDTVERTSGEIDDVSANLSTGRVKYSTKSNSSAKPTDSWATLKAPKTPSIEEIGEAASYTLPD
jgi:hypothetical protein